MEGWLLQNLMLVATIRQSTAVQGGFYCTATVKQGRQLFHEMKRSIYLTFIRGFHTSASAKYVLNSLGDLERLSRHLWNSKSNNRTHEKFFHRLH